MQINKTTAMVEASIFAAISVVVAVLMFFIPFLSIFFIFWAVPFVILGIRRGLGWALASLVTSFFLMSIIINPVNALLYALGLGFSAALFGGFLHKKISTSKALIYASIVQIFGMIVIFALSLLTAGIPLETALDAFSPEFVQKYSGQIVAVYKDLGVPDEQIERVLGNLNEVAETMMLALPAGTIFSAILTILFYYYIVTRLAKRFGYTVEKLPDFKTWRLSIHVGFIMLVLFILMNILDIYKLETEQKILFSLFGVGQSLCIIQAVSLLWYFIENKGFPTFLKVAFCIIFAFLPPFSLIAFCIGFIDCFRDFRKIRS